MRLKAIKAGRGVSLRDKFKQNHAHAMNVSDHREETPVYLPATVQNTEAITATNALLCDMGLYDHFKAFGKSDEDSNRIVYRSAQFIVWSYNFSHKRHINVTRQDVKEWFHELTHEQYTLLLDYSIYLVKHRQLQPSTVGNYVSDIDKLFAWGTLFAPADVRLPKGSNEGIHAVADQVRANQAQNVRRARSTRTIAEQIQQRRLPAGGLAALQGAVLQEIPWARDVRRSAIDDTAYRRFMELTISAIYVFSANGRQSGVADVRMGQVQDLLTNGFATTTKFKTNKKYGYQPITLSAVSKELVHLYVSVVRPQVCRQHPVQADHHVWLTYRGEPDLTVGKLVTSFFIRHCGLSVTITGIRGLVETTMHKRFKAGEITEMQRSAVQNINGHTSATTRDYYLLEDRVEDVYHAREAFGEEVRLNNEPDIGYMDDVLDELISEDGSRADWDNTTSNPWVPPPPLPLPLPLIAALPQPQRVHPVSTAPGPALVDRYSSPVPTARDEYSLPQWALPMSPPQVMDWGTAHPDYKTKKPTAQWTLEEKNYLGGWCQRYQQEHPDSRNVVAKCLKYLRSDPRAVAIFHAHHTLNSARLRNGLRQFTSDEAEEKAMRAMRFSNFDLLPEEKY